MTIQIKYLKQLCESWKVFAVACALAIILPGCFNKEDSEDISYFKRIFDSDTYQIYRRDIQQGNVLTMEKVEQIKIGLTREQVTYLLGTPVVPSLFHDNRWDYVYYFNPGKIRVPELYNLKLFFDRDRLVRIQKTKKIPKSMNNAL